jgi:hypothetical protein
MFWDIACGKSTDITEEHIASTQKLLTLLPISCAYLVNFNIKLHIHW